MIRSLVGPLLYQAQQWLRASATILRPRNTTDRLVLGANDQGTSSVLSVDNGSTNGLAIVTRGYIQTDGAVFTASSSCNPGIVLTETTNDYTCSFGLTSASGTLSSVGIYLKNNQLVFAYICGANGQMRYASLTLDGQTCTWATRSVGP